MSFKDIKGDTEGEIDIPCVRFLTCPLPVLVNCCHVLNMTLTKMKTSYWHPASASPNSSPSCLSPSVSHFLSSTHILFGTPYFVVSCFTLFVLFMSVLLVTPTLHFSAHFSIINLLTLLPPAHNSQVCLISCWT